MLNSGFVTTKVKESKEFYTKLLNFGMVFENEWIVILHTPGNEKNGIMFMLPEMDIQNEVFRKAYTGNGAWINLEMDSIDLLNAEYERLQNEGVEFAIEIRNEEYGDRHFCIIDPSGIPIDVTARLA